MAATGSLTSQVFKAFKVGEPSRLCALKRIILKNPDEPVA